MIGGRLPEQLPLALYSRKATLDVRDALARALARLVAGLRFAGSQTDHFEEVFDEWPSFEQTAVFPAAAVLPGEFRYAEALMTPRLIESTWEPAGRPGWGLYKTAELQTELQLVVRTDRLAERAILMRAVEEAFQPSGNLMTLDGPRYGVTVALPEYYGVVGRFALLGGSVIDNEDTAMREKRDAAFTVSASAPKVQVGAVWPMALSVTKVARAPDGSVAGTETKTAP